MVGTGEGTGRRHTLRATGRLPAVELPRSAGRPAGRRHVGHLVGRTGSHPLRGLLGAATSIVGDAARVSAWSRELPIFGAVGATGLPGCYLFPAAAEPLKTPADGSISKAPPIVIVSSTRDPGHSVRAGQAAAGQDPRLGRPHVGRGRSHRIWTSEPVPRRADHAVPDRPDRATRRLALPACLSREQHLVARLKSQACGEAGTAHCPSA